MLTTKHLPQSYTGQRFCEFFKHRFNFIKSSYSSTSEWITISDYPLEHRNLWCLYQDPERLVGLSFGTTTRYAVLDIDRHSPYHPANSELQYRELLGAYEGVGINSVVTVQSSFSGGLHIYFVFPKALPTFNLARMLRLTAVRAGYEVKDGTLEIFPNTKAFSKQGKTAYKPLRLPLQQGSYLLDKDFVPYSNEIEVFLNQAEAAGEDQDPDLIEVAIETASHIKNFRRVKGDGDACSFAQDLREQIAEGWTGSQQTNDLLRIIGTYGRVFKGLEGQALADYILTKAEASPGYRLYCQHQHNIHRRAKDWGRCIEKYYYSYGSEASRVGTFNQLQKSGSRPPKENVVNQSRQEEAIDRIKEGVNYVIETVKVLPRQVGEWKRALVEAIIKLFGKRPSDETLYRYKEWWHPQHIKLARPESSSQSSEAVSVQTGVTTEKGKNRTLTENGVEPKAEQDSQKVEPRVAVNSSKAMETELDTQLSSQCSSAVSRAEAVSTQLIELEAHPDPSTPEALPREASEIFHTPLEKRLEKEELEKALNPSCGKASKVFSTPPRYMKVFVLDQAANGLVSKRLFGKESRPKLCSISSGSEVRFCRGYRHSQHPELVYIKPTQGAEDWIGGIAVLFSSLTASDGV